MRYWLQAARTRANRLVDDRRAQAAGGGAAGQAANTVVSIFVAALVAAYLLPMAINEIAAVDTSSWTNGAAELWSLLMVMIVLSIFLFFVNMALNTGDRL